MEQQSILVVSEHKPGRPRWDCQACGHAWPCALAQKQLTEETPSRSVLRMRMWDSLEQAAYDMPHAAASEMFARFLRWTG